MADFNLENYITDDFSSQVDDPIDNPTEDPIDPPADDITSTPNEGEPKSIFDVFVDRGILTLPEDFQYDETEESLEKLLEYSSKVQREKALEAALDEFPEDAKRLLEYARNGGDINEFFNTKKQFEDLTNVDITTLENQKNLLTHYYKTTSKYTDEKINRVIDKLENMGAIEESAVEALEELKELKEQRLQDMIAEKQTAKQKAEEKTQEYAAKIGTVIESLDSDSTTKAKIKSLIFDPVKTQEGVVNKYYVTLSQIEEKPEHFVQLVELLADYDPEKGLQLTKIKQQAKSKGFEQVKNLLQRNLNNSTVPKGNTGPSSDSNFDWERFANN